MCAYNTDTNMSAFYYRTFLPFILVLWSKNLRFIDRLTFPCIILSLVITSLYIVCAMNDNMINIIGMYALENLKGNLSVGKRIFLGVDVISIYYGSMCIFLTYLPICCYKFLKKKTIKYLLLCCMCSLMLLSSGIRAYMASCIGLIALSFILYLWERKHQYFAVFLCFFAIASAVTLAIMLLSDAGEPSLNVKTLLVKAFFEHIENNPETLIWGNGVGATFDSLGVRGTHETQSELFYLEIIRFFGIPLGMIFLSIYVYPYILIFRQREDLQYWKYILLGYTFYLLSAWTNPYLTSSNGMLTLLIMYSYALNPYYKTNGFNYKYISSDCIV